LSGYVDWYKHDVEGCIWSKHGKQSVARDDSAAGAQPGKEKRSDSKIAKQKMKK
jgi:hypothetical protein